MKVEVEYYSCAFCKTGVRTEWVMLRDGTTAGMKQDRNNTLVADWVFHTSCWDILVRQDPP